MNNPHIRALCYVDDKSPIYILIVNNCSLNNEMGTIHVSHTEHVNIVVAHCVRGKRSRHMLHPIDFTVLCDCLQHVRHELRMNDVRRLYVPINVFLKYGAQQKMVEKLIRYVLQRIDIVFT